MEQESQQPVIAEENNAPQTENNAPQTDDQLEKERLIAMTQRAQADLINYRRRASQERIDDRLKETRRLGLRMLEILDQLETALADDMASDDTHIWRQGVEAVCKKFRSMVVQEGFERFDAQGAKFNPVEHDALFRRPTDEYEDSDIIDQISPGYRHRGEVIRPAQVVVAAPPIEADENKPEVQT